MRLTTIGSIFLSVACRVIGPISLSVGMMSRSGIFFLVHLSLISIVFFSSPHISLIPLSYFCLSSLPRPSLASARLSLLYIFYVSCCLARPPPPPRRRPQRRLTILTRFLSSPTASWWPEETWVWRSPPSRSLTCRKKWSGEKI